MNSLLHRDTDEDVEDTHSRPAYHGANGKDREITLGTTMVLGIFFALAVFGAVFFGIGYSLGSKRAAALASAPIVDGGSGTSFSNFKPAPGSPLNAPGLKPAAADAASQHLVPATVPAAPVASALRPLPQPAASAQDEGDAPARPASRPAASAANVALPAVTAPGPGTSVVQVAAVSHQEDADLLVSTLKRRGYAVGIRNESQDKLLHIQIGPFATHKDADIVRQKLLADGFNAIVK